MRTGERRVFIMTSVANPHGFTWHHEKGNQFLVVDGTQVHVGWKMPEADLRAALAEENIVGHLIEAAVAYVRDYRIDFGLSQQAIA